MHDCDVMLCIGARFDDRITGRRLDAFSPGSKKIHIDIDAVLDQQERPLRRSHRRRLRLKVLGGPDQDVEEAADLATDKTDDLKDVVAADRGSGAPASRFAYPNSNQR